MIFEVLPCSKACSSFAGLDVPVQTPHSMGGGEEMSEQVDVGWREGEFLVFGRGCRLKVSLQPASRGRIDPRYWGLEGHLALLEPNT